LAAIFDALRLDLWTFIFQAANVLIIMAIFYALLWKPVSKVLEEREHKIESQLADAANAKEQSAQLLKDYEAKMLSVKQEAHDIIASASRLGEDMKEELINKAREEAEQILIRSKTEIQLEKAKALATLQEEVAVLSVLIAGRVLSRSISDEDHRRLVQEAIEEVREVQ